MSSFTAVNSAPPHFSVSKSEGKKSKNRNIWTSLCQNWKNDVIFAITVPMEAFWVEHDIKWTTFSRHLWGLQHHLFSSLLSSWMLTLLAKAGRPVFFEPSVFILFKKHSLKKHHWRVQNFQKLNCQYKYFARFRAPQFERLNPSLAPFKVSKS